MSDGFPIPYDINTLACATRLVQNINFLSSYNRILCRLFHSRNVLQSYIILMHLFHRFLHSMAAAGISSGINCVLVWSVYRGILCTCVSSLQLHELIFFCDKALISFPWHYQYQILSAVYKNYIILYCQKHNSIVPLYQDLWNLYDQNHVKTVLYTVKPH